MRKRLLIVPFITMISIHLAAQKNKISFHSINSVSFLIGESATDWSFQTVNGIAYKNLFSGIGAGVDYYHYNSCPLFFDQRIFFGKGKNLFAYGDLGYNFNNKNNKPGKEIGFYSSYHFTGSVYAGIGFGYKQHFAGKSFLNFSAGFSYKQISNRVNVINECFVGPCTVDYNTYQYDNGRAVLQAGIDF